MSDPITTSSPTDGPLSSPALATVDVVALTTRDDFLLELGQALGGQASVTPVESITQALEHVQGSKKRLYVLAVDSRGVADLRADIDLFSAQAPQVATLVFAEDAQEDGIAASLEGSPIFAALSVPLDIPKTAAVFESAVADLKSRESAAPRPAPIPQSQPDALPVESAGSPALEPIQPVQRDSGEIHINVRAMASIVIAVIVALGLWFLTRHQETRSAHAATGSSALTPRTGSEPAQAIETSVVKGKVDDLLEKARQAMRERRYTEPTGDNALLYYRSAAYADSANGEALDGLNRVATVIATRFEEAIASSHAEEAALALAQLKSAVPRDARLGGFQTQLADLRAQILRAEQEEARQKRVAQQQAAREAAAQEQRKAREAKAAAAEAQRQAREQEKAEEEKAGRTQAAKATAAPAQATPQSASPQYSPRELLARLKRKRYTQPEYPQDLLERGVGGVVTVSFTVNVKGETQDIRVESAEPAGAFDKAAVDAVKRWRYEPLVVDGVPTEVPVRLGIRFEPPK